MTTADLTQLERDVRARVRDVPDFPKPGILFKDLTPVLADPALFGRVVQAMAAPFQGQRVRHVVGMEARGFMFGAPVALALGAGFVPARKPGKLPWKTERYAYALEYGQDALEVHADCVAPGERVLVVDDLLATGGTAAAAEALVRKLGGHVVGFSFAVKLDFLRGEDRLGAKAHAVVTY